LSYKGLKPKLRLFLAGHIVAMVTCYIKRVIASCLPMIGQLQDSIIVALVSACLVKQW